MNPPRTPKLSGAELAAQLAGTSQIVIQFDAARDGAKQKTATFSREDIELVARGPWQPPEQPATLPL